MHKVLVNRLGGLSLPRKSVVRLTDRPDMTLDVYRGRKTTMQLSHFRQFFFFFCIVGYVVCVINSSYSFQCIFLKPCILVMDIMKIRRWIFDGPIDNLRELRPFELSLFGSFFCTVGYGVCVVNSSYSFQ